MKNKKYHNNYYVRIKDLHMLLQIIILLETFKFDLYESLTFHSVQSCPLHLSLAHHPTPSP